MVVDDKHLIVRRLESIEELVSSASITYGVVHLASDGSVVYKTTARVYLNKYRVLLYGTPKEAKRLCNILYRLELRANSRSLACLYNSSTAEASLTTKYIVGRDALELHSQIRSAIKYHPSKKSFCVASIRIF